jgi:hypothetical protein
MMIHIMCQNQQQSKKTIRMKNGHWIYDVIDGTIGLKIDLNCSNN